MIGSITFAGALLGATPASAQEQKPSQVRAATEDPSSLTTYRTHDFLSWDTSSFWAPAHLQLHGGLENDIGFARYTFENTNNATESFYDLRGRFVLEPSLTYDFGRDHFVRIWAQFVVWMRELSNVYQGGADDIVVQVGQKDVWDLMVGRFFTWRVYRKGLGFDLYTLEDTGALARGPIETSAAAFGPHTYEVNDIFYRGTPGRAAFHLYPTSWSGIEVAAEYGKFATTDTLGTRAAGNITYGPVSVSAAAEYRHNRASAELKDEVSMTVCDTCSVTNKSGYGGGAVFHLSPVEVGGNGAIAHQTVFAQVAPGSEDKNGAVKTTSLGGYAEVDVGSLLLRRQLVAGAGLNRTETAAGNDDSQQHLQGAVYLFFPLGFNDASLKLVLSRSDLQVKTATGGGNFLENKSHMYAGRVRIVFKF
jgi:hypothetical protein